MIQDIHRLQKAVDKVTYRGASVLTVIVWGGGQINQATQNL